MNVGDVMDEIAVKLRQAPSLAGRTYDYPPGGTVDAPAAIVTYPNDGTFDETYGRGTDSMTGVVVVVCGLPTDRHTRDRVAKYTDGSGAESVKVLLDGEEDDYSSCDGVRVSGWEADVYGFGGSDQLVVVFQLDIVGPGTA